MTGLTGVAGLAGVTGLARLTGVTGVTRVVRGRRDLRRGRIRRGLFGSDVDSQLSHLRALGRANFRPLGEAPRFLGARALLQIGLALTLCKRIPSICHEVPE